MWEFTSGVTPFNNREHNYQLALCICQGERPEIIENTPQCYVDLMKKCWNNDPSKRPSAKEVLNIIKEWIIPSSKIKNINEELKNNIMEFINAPIGHNKPTIQSHPQAYYTSRVCEFTSKELNDEMENLNLETMEIPESECSMDDFRIGIYRKNNFNKFAQLYLHRLISIYSFTRY